MKNIFRSFALSSVLLLPTQALSYGGDAPHEAVYLSDQYGFLGLRGHHYTQSDLEAVNKLSGKAKAKK